MEITQLNFIITLVTDLILLLVMFIGLLRLGFHERGAFGLGRLLWRQVGYLFSFGFGVVFSIR
jgi:hypothetical protein